MLLSPIMRLIIFLILFTLLCTSIMSCEGENSDGDDQLSNSTTTTTTTKPTDEPDTDLRNVAGAGRATGGTIVTKPPQFIGHVFGPESHNKDHRFGRHGGFTTHLDGHHAIVHQKSLDKLSHHQVYGEETKDSHMNFPVRDKVDAMDPANVPVQIGLSGGVAHPISNLGHSTVQTNLGGSQFHLVKFDHGENFPHINMSHFVPKEIPKLETSKDEFGSDCHMYSYGWGGSSRKGKYNGLLHSGADLGSNPRVRKSEMMKIPVSRYGNSCDNGMCKMRVKSEIGQVCKHHQDLGAPILCGKQQKVTYLAHPRITGEHGQCTQDFDAFHVPHLVDDVKKHVPINQEIRKPYHPKH